MRIVPELAARVPGLAEPMRADAETERFRLFEASPTCSPRCRPPQPVVLVLDDVHWADKPSLLLLRHLLRVAIEAKILSRTC